VKTILILIITMHPAAVHTNIERVLSFGVVRTTRIPGTCDPNGRCVEIVNEGSALGCLCVNHQRRAAPFLLNGVKSTNAAKKPTTEMTPPTPFGK